jgi:hypothetical protein
MSRRSARGRHGPAKIDGLSVAEFMARQARNAPAATPRDDRRILISPGLWNGYEVTVEPPIAACPLRSFKILADALEHANALYQAHGWTVIDQTGEPSPTEVRRPRGVLRAGRDRSEASGG